MRLWRPTWMFIPLRNLRIMTKKTRLKMLKTSYISAAHTFIPSVALPIWLINHWDTPLTQLIIAAVRRTLPWSPQTGRSSSRPLSSAAAGPVGAQLPHSPTKWRWSRVPPQCDSQMPTVAAEFGQTKAWTDWKFCYKKKLGWGIFCEAIPDVRMLTDQISLWRSYGILCLL